jgi:DNA polymerase alpha subunit A
LFSFVLDQILSGKQREEVVETIHSFLRQKADEIRQGKVPLAKYIITKGLTKNPEEYPDAKSQPHVQVALKMTKSGRSVKVGDHVPYVICEGDSPSYAERAFHPDHIQKADGLIRVDVEWYLSQQVTYFIV